MSSAKECVAQAIETLNVVRGNQQQIILKEEQQVAIEKLLLGQDVRITDWLWGKYDIYRICKLLPSGRWGEQRDISTCILVIPPLTSITADQVLGMHSLGIDAVDLNEHTTTESIRSPP